MRTSLYLVLVGLLDDRFGDRRDRNRATKNTQIKARVLSLPTRYSRTYFLVLRSPMSLADQLSGPGSNARSGILAAQSTILPSSFANSGTASSHP